MELAEENLDEHHLDEKEVVDVVVRFAGDSGDGMQLTGTNFTEATALYGNDLSTFPDFPAEIRAPIGATFGVSAFQIYFGAEDVTTAGDALDVLVAMNPAALTTNIGNLVEGGLLIVDSGAFTAKNQKHFCAPLLSNFIFCIDAGSRTAVFHVFCIHFLRKVF